MKKAILTVFVLVALFLFAADSIVVKRNHAVLRMGPGSFYPVIAKLPIGTNLHLIKIHKGWLQVEYNRQQGFVSAKVSISKNKKKNDWEKMAKPDTEVNIAQMGMTAGVKGFAEKISKNLNSDPSFISYFMNYNIDPLAYRKFYKKTYKKIKYKKARRKNHLPPPEKTRYYSYSEQGLGIAIAAKLASMGIYKDKRLTNYLNYFGNLIVSASDAYDENFKFFVLNINQPNAYACPGGIIFITKGMLQTIDNEAELACVIGHEVAHVARKHGMKEVDMRVNEIHAEGSFNELDQELEELGKTEDKDIKSTEDELEKMSLQIYETISKGRLGKYEKEADKLGLLYATRAGFNPKAMLTLLNKMQSSGVKSNNEHYSQKQIGKRINRIRKNINELYLPKKMIINHERYKAYKRKMNSLLRRRRLHKIKGGN